MQADDAVGWVGRAQGEGQLLIATSAGYLLRCKSTKAVVTDLNNIDCDNALVRCPSDATLQV